MIIDYKEQISDLQYWRNKASFIADMVEVEEANLYDSGIEEVCCIID